MANNTQSDTASETEPHFSSFASNALSVPYPYSRTPDGGETSPLSVEIGSSAEIDRFCDKHNLNVDSYIMGALLCALLRIIRQDRLVLFCHSSSDETPILLPLIGSMQWMELPAHDMIRRAEERYSQTLLPAKDARKSLSLTDSREIHLLYTHRPPARTTQGKPQGDLIHFFSDKAANGCYTLSLTYNPQPYSRRDMQTLLDAWQVLVTEFCRQDCPVNKLPILTPEENDRLLALGNGDIRNPYNPDDYDLLPKNVTIVENFIRIAHESPQKNIVFDSEGSYTCEQLNLYSNRVAHWLITQGIPQGSVIGILTPRCKEYLALAFGILKADCAIVTLEEDYPEERRNLITEDARIHTVLKLDTFTEILASDTDDSDICLCTIDSIFQIFYTSGTTGKPKGVVRSLAELTNALSTGRVFGFIAKDESYLNIVRFSFVASIANVWIPIGYGSTLHIVSGQLVTDPSAIADYITKNGITYALMPAGYGVMLVNNYDLPLKVLFLSADKIPAVTNHKVKLFNLYASTEVLWMSCKEIHPDDTRLTAGTPKPGTQLYILDENQNLLPQGTVGEICISSNTMAREYLNDSELNAKKFLNNPFVQGKRMLRSGDLGYFDENGELNIVGRADNMVKLRGYRIELDEITYTAMRCPGVDMCACTKVTKGGVEVLCCYYTSTTGVTDDVLKAHLSESLPPYMVPDIYMLLDRMPLNANGKIDRKALPEPEFKAENVVHPATEDEQQVLEIAEGLMGVRPISVTTNLLSLGLSSISAMRLAMRISKELGRSITMSQLMKTPTVRGIAANLSSSADSNFGQVRERQKYYPLTDNQLGVYLDWEQHREGLQYNIPYVLKLKGYDANRLKTAVETVVSAHPYLKARLAVARGEVMLQRRDEDSCQCDIATLDRKPDTDFFQSRVRPFNLLEDSLCRIDIYTHGEEVYLFLDIHHIITDGLSDARLTAEIFRAYNGEAIALETFTAFDRAIEEQEIKWSETYTQAEAYYKNLLADLESTSYPHSSNDLGSGKAGYVRQTLDKSAIEEHCARLGVTASNYLLTIFMEVLRRITREDKVLITAVSSGREHAAMQDIQGFFVKTLPVVSADTVAEVQSQLIESISHECYPLTEMVQSLGIRPEIMYAYEGGLFEDDNLALHEGVEIIPLSLDTAKVPLTLTVNPDGKDFDLSVEYDDSLYNEADMQALLHSIVTLAQNYAKANADSKDAAASLPDCSMLTEEEEQHLIALGTGETLEYDKSKTFIDLFREQVAKTPDAVAVVDGFDGLTDRKCSQLTYRELDEASDEYAKTVVPGTFVCLEMPRVKEFVVAVLGIWKAGSAYVPIDTEYPEERKQFMRQECDGKPLPQPDVAYMIYTSGSTGRPKGVMIPHLGLTNFIISITKQFGLTAHHRISCHCNFCFDASVEDLYPILSVGGTLYIVPEEIRTDLDGYVRYLLDNDIKGGNYSTQFGLMLASSYPELPLEYINIGGEAMSYLPKCKYDIYNTYGPTECTDDSTYIKFDKEKDYPTIPIGRPLDNLQSFICDSQGHLLPHGVTGELCIAGPQLALGYYNNPKLTAERFVDITIGGKTVKIYKTGDLCRWNADGQLEYIGRIDNQVKLRGFRIELGEIESAALQIEGIRQAVAMVRNERIVLYYTGSSSLDTSLFSSLPEYMVPNAFVRLDAMPLTPNGKIDRKALPEPEYKAESIVLPATVNEKQVLWIVEEMMGLSPISVTSNLISQGLSSISAMRIAMRLSKSLGKSITMSQLMSAPTVRGIAANLSIAENSGFGQIREKREYYPLTDNQLGVYLDWEQHRGGLQYNIPYVLKLRGYDANRLKTAVETVVSAHPYLKARLVVVTGEVMLQRRDEDRFQCDIATLDREPDTDFFQSRVRSFNLFEDSLCRFEIYTCGEEVYLFLDIHHIITDGLSDARLTAEIFRAYNGEAIETETFTAFDRAIEEQEIKQSEAYSLSESYYRNLLADLESTSYPHSTSELGSGKAGYVRQTLGKRTIEEHCVRLGVTASNYLLTVFMEVLRRITREDKVLITAVSSGREHAAMQDIQGFFVKTLPVVSADTVAEVQSQLIESISHECYPLTEMVQCLGIRPEIMYAYEGGLFEDDNLALHEGVEIIPLSLDTAKVPLTLTVNPDGKDFDLSVEYEDSLYNEAAMQTLLHSITVLAENYAKADNKQKNEILSLQDCSMLTEEEKQRLIALGTGETLDYDRSKTFIDLFREQVAKTPNAVAVVYKDIQLTYKELDEITDRLAVKLHTSGVAPEVTVGVLIDRSELMAVYPLAIMKAGGAYMPLDPTFPEERLLYMCKDAELSLILSDEGLAEKVFPSFEGTVTDSSVLDSMPEVTTDDLISLPKAGSDNKFVVLYTSGSTGKPKGVVLEHHGIVNFCHWYVKEYDMTAEDNTMALASFGFDAHMMDIYPALTCGATVFVIPEEMRKDINALNEYMEANEVSIAFMTTQLGYLFATTIENRSLRLLSVSGEKLMPLRKPPYRFYNAGAPTECTIYAFNYNITEEYYDASIIGKPISNVNIHLVDSNLHLVPQGVPGEMIISGQGVGRGYLNLPEQNAARFITFLGQRAYRTGDLCRWNADGLLEYIGRIDNQVKLRGFRIELGEIESAALQMEGIRQAVAMVRNERIVLYYTAIELRAESLELRENSIEQKLSSSLPSYMVPSAFVQMDAMPLTPNGKIDRKALPEPEYKAEVVFHPATKDERQVLEIAEGLMGICPISVTANLISLGLSSIAAMRLAMRISKELGRNITMSQLMKTPTVRDIAANLSSSADSNFGKVREKRECYPLTDNQLGVYLDWEQHREGLQYNIPYVLKLKGYNADRLKAAVEAVVAAHPYLKARLAVVDGEVLLQRRDEDKLECFVKELDIEPDTDASEESVKNFFQSRVRLFNLLEDSLCRFEIYTYGEDVYLFRDIHHIITDGLSDARLTAEIFRAYNGEAIALETFTAFDRALEEQEIKQSEAYSQAENYYKNLLAYLESTSYPHSTSELGSGKAGYVRQTLGKRTIEEHCVRLGVTASNYLLTVFMEVLRRITREDKVLITAVSSGREHVAMQDIQGFFVKTLPVVSADTVAEVQSQLIESIGHECYPLTEMVQQMGIRPEIMYAYEGGLFENASATLHDGIEALSLSLDTAKVPLTLTVNPDGKDYDLSIEYDDALYNEADMQTLLHSIVTLAQNYAKANADSKDAAASMQDCSMLTEEETQHLIELGKGETLDYDQSKTFIDLFREQAAKTPDAVAVVDGFDGLTDRKCSQLTYRELDEASDEYAKTVVPGTFVCLEMPRVKEFVVAVLGIWKAGSAYVPIDTEYPEERKQFMQQECDGKPLPQPDVAYMIYTSGSTGKPKGVMVQHPALVHFVQFVSKNWILTPESRICCNRSFSFDASMEDIFPVLTVGGRLYIEPEEVCKDVGLLYDYVVTHGITGGSYPTQVCQILLQQYPELPVDYIVCGGEKMKENPKCKSRLINAYGPTENTVDATYYELEHNKTYENIPIGRPLDDVSCLVLDKSSKLLPLGAIGELCIAGPQLALGYWNNPELTAEKFVDIPIGGKTIKVYKTGDLCRWNVDGQLEYIGRIDNQIKLRGFRIELGEIESAALLIEGIQQAVAMVKNERIVLYYTAIELRENRIKQELSSSLPSYMVPSAFVQMDAMPLTPNGKIDRKALPEPEYKAESIVLPATVDEKQVLWIVEEMMGLSPISVTSNLISQGLSSISAMRLAMRISKELGRSITMSQLMKTPTVRGIAANLSSSADSNFGQVRERQKYYPLTDNQLGVYLDWEQHREGLQYNIPYVLKLKGYDANRLKTAVETVVSAHPYLKARLAVARGEVMLQRRDEDSCQCDIATLDRKPDTDFFQSRVRPFNLLEDSLCRFEIYTYGEEVNLFLDIHHIITDGLSDARLASEIFRAYNGEAIETETFTAFDRAIEEQEIKQSDAYTQAEAYYKNLLADLESTSYPHSSNDLGSGKAGYVRQTLGKSAIEEHCARLGVTASNYLLTIFMEVLRRITREDKVLITAVSSGREHAAMQDIQGFLVKTLPVVSADTVAEVQSQLIESISHECYPLTEMVQSLGIRPEIMYAYEGGLFEDDNLALHEGVEIIPLSLDTAKVPLTLTVNPDGKDFDLSVEYEDSLYNEADMQALLHSIVTLAQNYAKANADSKDAAASMQDCSMLTEDEEQHLIALGTGETLEYDKSKTFIDLFREQAAKTPNAVAVVYKDIQLTYKELNEITDRLAVKLHTSGVAPEVTVGVLIDRSELMAVYPLAIMKAGGAYMPLDPTFPEERLLYMCKDAGLSLILSDEGLAEKVLPSFKGTIIGSSVLDSLPEVTAEELGSLPKAAPDNKFVILYTSGSTGKPKGVVLENHGIVNFCHWYIDAFNMTSSDRALAYAGFGFDAHMMDVYPALVCAASVYILPADLRMDPAGMNRYMEESGISIAFLTTQLGHLFVNTIDNHSLRLLSLGGEKLQAIRKPAYRLVNGYGPTECTIYSSFYEIETDYDSNVIGRPLNGVRLYVIDHSEHLVSEGSIGELAICGEGVARGYLNDSELTAERFVDVQIGGKTIKIYKTGDLCRWNSDGQLEYIGRIDNQVKLRGFRIELGELESAALQIEGIRQAVAMVKNEQIVLYYTGVEHRAESLELRENSIKQELSSSLSLPSYMVPSAFVLLDAMPLTPNGKIDRKALPEPTFVQEEYVAPRNDAERVIAYTFKEVLNLNDEVSVTSRFYSLGGDSIKSIRLVSLLSQKGYKLSVADVMKLQTSEALAAVAVVADTEEESFSIPFPIEKHYPLTPMQEAMLLKQLSEPDSWGYRLVSRYRLNVIPTEMQLRTALDALAVEHETLRTRIIYKDVETPEQEITERAIPLSFEDIRKTGRTPEDIHTEQLNLGFDLQEDLLMRVVCIITGDRECQLLIAMHHIITDGWSLSLYLGHLFQHLKDVLDGKEITVTDTDDGLFEQHVRSLMLRDKDNSLAYWKNLLDGYETKAEIVSYENISTEEKENANDHLSVALDTEQTDKLKAVCAANGATLSHATELAWGIVLQRHTRLDDVVFAKVVSCRDKAPMDMSTVVGPFINSIPVRVKTDSDDSLSEALLSVSNQAAESNAHDYCSLSEIQQQSALGNNLFQSILAFENYPVSDEIKKQFEESDSALHIEALDNQEESFNDIALAAFERDGRLQLNLTFDKEQFSETEMRNVLSAWKQVLIQTADTPDMSVAEVGLLSEDEEQRLIELGTGETLDYDRTKTFIDLFREQVAKTPDAVAVVDGFDRLTNHKCSQLTYRELDEASDEYAKTVVPGTFVCVEMPHVKEFVVAVLGIWKAGSAYVPIDTEYPEERKQFMRQECDGKPLPQPDVAYMIYTSGSTGRPKGVMVQHGAYLNYLHFYVHQQRLTSLDRMACHRNFSFDASLEDLYPILSVGGELHLMPEEIRMDVDSIRQFIIDRSITCCSFTTSLGSLLLQAYPDLPLRYMVVSGEKLLPIDNLQVPLWNFYGPTECTVDCVTCLIEQGKTYAEVPIGKTVNNLAAFVMDSCHCILPQGVAGELCIAGPQLALGYYNNTELTAEKFVDIPIGGKTIKVYKTGDLCRWNADGQLEYIGRIDNQIKLRGFRIELGEIESAALQIEDIQQAVAMMRNDQIVLYYTAIELRAESLELRENSIEQKLSSSLPSYMVPNAFVRLDSMPLTPNGKIDRKALPEPEYKAENVILPATKNEQQVLGIVESLMSVSPISVTDNLISLGLTSIAAMRLAMRISKELRCGITMSQLMSAPTVRDIVANLSVAENSDLGKVRQKQEYYPHTDNQLGVYLDWEQHREGLQYNIPYVLKLKGYNADRLKAAVEAVVAAHPYLKARLAVVGGEVLLQRRDEDKLECFVKELDIEPDTDASEESVKNFFQSRVRPFDLFEDSLCRLEIYTYGEDVYLFRDIHHIITDGLSDARLTAEIFRAYNGEAIALETFTAFDRAIEEQEIKWSETYTQAEAYYKNLLADLESTSYPHSTSELGSGKAGYVRQTLGKRTIEEHCVRLGVTASNYLLTVFMEALKRITREDKVLITAVSSGREHAAMQGIQGFFVKTLPVVSADTVAEVQSQLIESISHECYPLTEMVQSLGIRPEIMYAYEGGLFEDDNLALHEGVEIIPLSLDTAKVPLTLTVNLDGKDFDLSVEYDDSLYNEADMQALLHSIVTLAQNYAKANADSKDAAASMQDCLMLTEEEEQHLIALGTGETLEYDKTKTFIDLFREQAAKTPDAVAVVDKNSQLTYWELDEASDKYAKTVTPGTFVCLEMPRVKEFVVAVLGIWKAGSAYVPIDTEYPEERKNYMRQECASKPLPQPDIAYMIYTSGSTGKPKGVMVKSEGLLSMVLWNNHKFPQGIGTRHLVHSSFSFDASVFEFVPPLATGGEVYILDEQLRYDIPGMVRYIHSNQVTAMVVSTQLGIELIGRNNLPLQYMMLAGEKMPSLSRMNSNFRLYNGFGPTEFTVCSAYYEVGERALGGVPIGRPVPNSQSFICDGQGHLLPQGAIGELCLAGPQLALGYWNNPELTAERFVDVTIGGKNVKIYKTGDLCRWNSDSQLEYIGRIDNQVKLRGFRIELGEIESAVLQIEGIQQAVAMVKNERIVLYYTGVEHRAESLEYRENSIEQELSSSLPSYMVPIAFVRLDAMPLTPNGKIDRKALPDPEYVQEEYVAPRNEAEQVIADTFKEVLNLNDEVSISSRFYSLGGDSIKSIRLVSLLSQKGYKLSVADVMKLQTSEALAAVAVVADTEEESFSIPFPIEKHYPLTPMQEAMLLKQLSEPDSWGYRLVSRYRLNVIPTETQLRTALDALAIEHETLRTRIIYKDAEVPEQEITDRQIPFSFEDIRKTGRTPEEIHTEQLNLGFDLQEDLLMRVVCIITGDRECQLLIAMHHIITDGWSLSLYLGHLFQHLKDALDGKDVSVTDTDAGLFEQHVRSLMLRDKEDSLSYWKNLLDGYETKAEIVSYENISAEEKENANDHLSVALDTEQTDKLKAVCAANGATLSHAAELAWGIVLQRHTRLDDVVFAKVVSCRDKAPMDMSTVVGPFINSIPVRVKTDGDDSLSEALLSVSNQAAESNAHDYCSLSEIQQQSALGNNLFQSILAFENYPVSDEIKKQFEESDSALHIEALDNQEESFNDIALSAFERDGRLQLNLTFDKEKFSEAEMQNALSAWKQVLIQTADTPDMSVAEVGLLSEDEEQRLIALGTGETLEYDKSNTFIDLFREQAAKTPDAVAVVDGFDGLTDRKCSQLTYRELDEASDEYAKTVTPGTFVCVEMPRVKEFVVAVLGIWKAGSAYVPIDTEYPEERKKFMREECDGKPLPSPDIAYMIYTSGSTGRPKGVMVQHSALAHFVQFISKNWRISQESRICCNRSFSFDASLEDMFPVLTVGGRLCIEPEDVCKDICLLYDFVIGHGITGGSYPTQVGQILLQQYPEIPMDYIVCGGEKMKDNPKCNSRLINAYGPTENTVDATYYELEHNKTYENIPIGKPLDDVLCFVLDKSSKMLPQGTVGELCISGPQLALGYYNNPELTAERFTDITIGGKQVRIYKTGDLCRWNKEGQLEYIGRIDNQVKLRGFRIELEEIESAALQIEGVRQAVAMVRNERIVLYYVNENEDENEDRIEQELSSSLPSYMVPSVFVQLDSMPLTPNGKIDRKALPEQELVQEEYIAPESRNEKLLCKAIEELLGVELIGVTDSFRSCGMSSIQAMRLNMLLHKMGIHVNLSSILRADSVQSLCQFIDEGIDSTDVGCWLNEFDSTKPTTVLCCGVISAEIITKNLSGFSEKYNIYVLQPIFNAWADIDKLSHEEIVTRYLELLNRDILRPGSGQVQTDISCIMGFSYGGELAYHLAVRWQAHTGEKPMVFMGDTVITDVKLNDLQQPAYQNEMEAYYYELQNEFFSKRDRLPVSKYDGTIILISAERKSPYRDANEREWKTTNEHIRIIPMDDNHNRLYEHQGYYARYLGLIDEIISKNDSNL